jgi:hypothetical protein
MMYAATIRMPFTGKPAAATYMMQRIGIPKGHSRGLTALHPTVAVQMHCLGRRKISDLAQSLIVLKRSMAVGYSGVENELFYNPRTEMLFGDAKKSIESWCRR